MKRFFWSSRFFAAALLAVLMLIAGIRYKGLFRTSSVRADSSQNLSGYAWSSNIGWISFNCTNDTSCATSNYGVNIDPATGNFSGNAWSNNIGWISFNQTTGCPESGCTTQPNLNTTTGAITGWAKALTADNNGWDGWIKLAGTASSGGAYGPTLSGTTFSGYSWGADVIGWMDWSKVVSAATAPTANLYVNTIGATSATIGSGQSATLLWTSTGATSCTAAGGFSTGGATSNTTGVSTGPLTSTQNYSISCSGLGGTSVPSNVTVTVTQPLVTITANPNRVADGGQTTISWSATYVNSCSVTGHNLSKSNLTGPDLASSTPNVVVSSTSPTYVISCLPVSPSSTASTTLNFGTGIKEF